MMLITFVDVVLIKLLPIIVLKATHQKQLPGCTTQHYATTLITVYLGHYVQCEGNCYGSGCSGKIIDMNVGHYGHSYLFVQLLSR